MNTLASARRLASALAAREGRRARDMERRLAKIAEYERFRGERLQPDLNRATETRDKVQGEIDQW